MCPRVVTAAAAAAAASLLSLVAMTSTATATEIREPCNECDANHTLLNPTLSEKYFFACSGGKLETIKSILASDPKVSNARTQDGETCLHLASISQSVELTQLLLDHGADPDVRTTFDKGQRMTPLSWNVYSGNRDVVAALLDAGAAVNLDFDLYPPGAPQGQQVVTVLDVADQLRQVEERDRFQVTYELLVKRGAKKYQDLGKDAAAAAGGGGGGGGGGGSDGSIQDDTSDRKEL